MVLSSVEVPNPVTGFRKHSVLRKLSSLPFFEKANCIINSSPPSSPRPTVSLKECNISCELLILSILQGATLTMEQKQQLVSDICKMRDSGKRRLIELLKGKGGAIESALENNACKAYLCKPQDLNAQLVEQNPEALEEMWNRLYQDTLPCLQSTLYPLEKCDSTFKIRKIVLTAFREHILIKLLGDVSRPIPDLDRILFAVLMESEGVSAEFIALSNKATGVCKEEPIERPIVKSRSKTLPNKQTKKVSFDTRKSATFTL